jgi:hypothetical protein
MCGADKGLKVDFDADSDGYDYDRAKKAGMKGDGTGEDKGHWGSVAPASDEEKKKFGLPDDAYVMLKGKGHPTWDKAVAGEEKRGAQIVKAGSRYFSVKF